MTSQDWIAVAVGAWSFLLLFAVPFAFWLAGRVER
jgi:uncharacterized membrane protein